MITPEDVDWKGIVGSISGIGLACTWLIRHNKAKSAAARDIHDDRTHEAKSDMEVDLLENMRTDRTEAFAQRDYWQKQAQDAWAHQIKDATRIATLEAENKYLNHELANVQTAMTGIKAQNERMRGELRNVRTQIEQLMAQIGNKPPARVRTDFGALDDEPGQ